MSADAKNALEVMAREEQRSRNVRLYVEALELENKKLVSFVAAMFCATGAPRATMGESRYSKGREIKSFAHPDSRVEHATHHLGRDLALWRKIEERHGRMKPKEA